MAGQRGHEHWSGDYPEGVPRHVDIPDEDLLVGFSRAVTSHPNRVATWFQGRSTTYAELADAISRAASALRGLGVTKGDRVALALPNCPAHVVAFLAVLRLGAVVVEHNPLYTADELERQLTDSGATVAICWQPTAVRVAEVQERTSVTTLVAVDVSKDLPAAKRLALRLPVARAREARARLTAHPPAGALDWHALVRDAEHLDHDHPRPAPSDLAVLQYTGGTTGNPKGAMLTHRNLVANPVMGEAWTGLSAEDPEGAVVYATLPLFHAYGLTLCLSFGLRIAATIVLFPRFDAEEVIDVQRTVPATFMPVVPPMLDRIVTAARDATEPVDFSSLRFVMSGAMPLPAATASAWEDLTGALVIEGYGLTECSPIALGNPFSELRRPGWLGVPFPSTDIRITDQDDPVRDVGPGERGELLVAGPQVFAGYWGRAAEDEGVLWTDDDGTTWLRTGDVVVQDEVGFVRLVDRIKEMIISGGFKIFPSQVEQVLRAMPGVADAAVVGLPAGGDGAGADLGEQVVAAIVPDDAARAHEVPVDVDAVRAWCVERLARYAIPRQVVVVDELPRSMIGKVLRREVRDHLLGR